MKLANKPINARTGFATSDMTYEEFGAVEEQPGMTLLEHYAGLAMQGDWASQDTELGFFRNDSSMEYYKDRAKEWMKSAQALIAVLEAEEQA